MKAVLYYFVRNWQLPFLNQPKGENDTENISWSISMKECCWPHGNRTHNLLITTRMRIQLTLLLFKIGANEKEKRTEWAVPCENLSSGHMQSAKAQISLHPCSVIRAFIRYYRMYQWRPTDTLCRCSMICICLFCTCSNRLFHLALPKQKEQISMIWN